MKSMTYAMKAEKALSAKKINCEIVKIDPQLTKRGCSYGVKFDCGRLDDLNKVFSEKGINYGDIIGER